MNSIGLVLHFRNHQMTIKCLQSLINEGIKQIVIIDNSEDNGVSLKKLRKHVHEHLPNKIICHYLEPAFNLGFSRGVNTGLKFILNTLGPSPVLLINSDATLEKGALLLLESAIRDKELAIAGCYIKSHDKKNSFGLYYYQRDFGFISQKAMPNSIELATGCCLLLSHKIISPSLFDEDFFFYGEDTELAWRLSQNKNRYALVESAYALHVGSASSNNGSLFYEYHMIRAHWLLAHKIARNLFEHILFLLGRSIWLPIRACLRSIRSRSLNPLTGLILATTDILTGKFRSLTPKASSADIE